MAVKCSKWAPTRIPLHGLHLKTAGRGSFWHLMANKFKHICALFVIVGAGKSLKFGVLNLDGVFLRSGYVVLVVVLDSAKVIR
jgi:hypothetical protein